MPELPDVEYFKKFFNRTAAGKQVKNISVHGVKTRAGPIVHSRLGWLKGQRLGKAYRRGKFLIIPASQKKLVFHFGMTGDFLWTPASQSDSPQARVILHVNGQKLQWINRRKLGGGWLVDNISQIKTLKTMGPEPLELSFSEFTKLLQAHKKKNIKAFLLDQSIIAGIGNIFGDEILYQAGISPRRKIGSLQAAEIKKLYQKTRFMLSQAIKRFGTWPENWLLTRRYEMICPRGHKLKRELIAGRAARYCPRCQR